MARETAPRPAFRSTFIHLRKGQGGQGLASLEQLSLLIEAYKADPAEIEN
jgi:hypothetical protein